MKHHQSKEAKESLIAFIKGNPELRLWQAIRTWSEHQFILVKDISADGEDRVYDTFYWEGKDK